MNLTEQITAYVSVILVMLTLLRIINGITGSRSVKDAVLLTAIFSSIALLGAVVAKGLMSFSWSKSIVLNQYSLASVLSNTWVLLWVGVIIYLIGLGVLLRLYVRSTRFKDWGTLGNLRVVPIVKYFRDKNRKKKGDRKGYETKSPKNVDDQKTIEILNKYLGDTAFHRRPLLIDNDDPWLTRKIVVSMMVELITSTNEEFNYVCCTVSPANIWKIIKLACNDDEECLAKMKQRLVFVDAYTETFGFGDEILTTRIEEMRTEDHISIVSCSSAAGVHKGTTDAFKILKDNAKKDLKGGRGACTVIYDTISALAISETEQEISEFIIHLTAAEQTYDMLSLFIEPDLESRESLSILSMRACCGKPIVIGGQHEAV